MSLLDSNNILRYAVILTVLAVTGYVGTQIKQKYLSTDTEKDYELVRKYLLNDCALYGNNKPKLWIHSKYELNARKWESFGSRGTTNLNQPYLHMTVKTVLHHCSDDFHIMLIDDDSFSKLLPNWEYGEMSQIPEPLKSQIRQIGLAMLIHKYGGMNIPNSFICMKSLKPLYELGILENRAFITESINRTVRNASQGFLPNLYFFGAERKNNSIEGLVEYLHGLVANGHLSDESQFSGDVQSWLGLAYQHGFFNLVDGDLIGIKTFKRRKNILIEDLMEERALDLSPDCYGIYIDQDEILRRTKYQWFAVMSTEEILNSSMILAKYLKKAIVGSSSECTISLSNEKPINSAI